MTGIGPHELLPIGTTVRVHDKRGQVTDAKLVAASNGGTVCLHTISFTERLQPIGCGRSRSVPICEQRAVNYAFITRA